MALSQKHNFEDADVEVELAERRLKKLSKEEMDALRERLTDIVDSGNFKKKDVMPLICGATDETFKRRLRNLMNKQFFELSKKLGAMYSNLEMDKLRERELLRIQSAEQEAEAYNKYSGEQLKKVIAELRAQKDQDIHTIEDNFNESLRKEQDKLRKKLHEKHFDEKSRLAEEELSTKREFVKRAMAGDEMKDDHFMNHVGDVLLKALQDQYDADKAQREKDKQAELDRMRLQLIASNQAEVNEMQRKIDD